MMKQEKITKLEIEAAQLAHSKPLAENRIAKAKQQLMTKPEQATLVPVKTAEKVELHGKITYQPGGRYSPERTMYQVSMTLEDYFKLDAEVNIWREENEDKPSVQGYQRVPEPQRSGKFGRYTLKGNPSYGNYIFNIRDKDKELVIIRENKADQTVDITIKPGCKVWIVDGGHRCTGLDEFKDDLLAESNGKLKNYQMPVTLTVGLSKKEEIVVFITENQTHKVVATDLAQRAMNDLIKDSLKVGERKAKDGGQIIYKDYSYVKSSYAIVDLIRKKNKQFKGRLRRPNKTPSQAEETTVSEKGFSDSLKALIGTRNAPLFRHKDDPDKVYRVLNNFWEAMEEVCPEPFAPAKAGVHDPKDYVIQQNIGIYSLHKLLAKLSNDAELPISRMTKDQFVEVLSVIKIKDHRNWKAANEKKNEDGGYWSEHGTNQKSFEKISDIMINSIIRQKAAEIEKFLPRA